MSLSGQQNIVVLRRAYYLFTGSIEAALLLDQLLYWSGRTDGRTWVAKSDAEFVDELCITRHGLRAARKLFEDRGIVITEKKKFNGAPTTHYRIDFTILQEYFEQWINSGKVAHFLDIEVDCANPDNDCLPTDNPLFSDRQSLTETTTEITNNTIQSENSRQTEFSEQSINTSEQSPDLSSGKRTGKACPPKPPKEAQIEYPGIDKLNGFGALIPTTPGGILLFDKLKEEAHAKGHRPPVRFASIAQRDAFIEIEKRIGGDLSKAIDYTLRQGITSIKAIVNYLDKWGTQPNNGRKAGGYIDQNMYQNVYQRPGVIPTGKVVNEDGSLNLG